MKKILLSLLFLCICAHSFSQLVAPFTQRKQFSQKGGIRYISNVSISCSGGCTATAQVPPGGTGQNNNFTAAYVDNDGVAATFMSSSDSLALPSCSQISWAGLYWGGASNTGQANYANRFSAKVKVNNDAYQTITALAADRRDNATGYTSYHAFADITSIAQAAGGNARFTVADVFGETGASNKYGGWTIVIIYKNDLQPMRNLTVFNGLASVSSGANSTVDVPISGFLTPLSGPVTFELGAIAYDGDRSQTGDQLLFNSVAISDGIHSASDMFNSTLSYNGVLTPFRKPSLNNTLGYDANIFIPDNSAKNYIGNSATSATIRITTSSETILLQTITSAIDIYEPDLRAAVTVRDVNGGIVQPGDTLEYSVLCKNIGSDPSVNTFITDTLEGNAQFVPGSIRVFYGPNTGLKTDASADDQGEYLAATKTVRVRIGTGANGSSGGQMLNSPAGNDSTIVRFRVTASTDCVYLQCDNIINNRAYIFGTGNVSGNTFNNGSNPGIFDINGCPIPGTTASPINTTACAVPAATSNSPVCLGSTISLSATNSPSATYSWAGPNSFTSSSRTPNIANATAAMAGTYTATISIPGIGCSFAPTTSVVVTNCVPAANDDTGSTLTEDGANGTINILTNDTDPNGNPTAPTNGAGQFTVDLDPATAGIQTSFTNTTGAWTYNAATGVVTFDPANNYNGSAVITYELCDPTSRCDQATITFAVTAVNDAPVAVDNTLTILEDAASGVLNNIIANDSDVDNTLVPTNIDLNTTLAGIQTSITTTAGSWTLNTTNGNVTFVPALNFNGTATLPYEICDGGTPNQCAQANLVVTVTAVNDAPVAVNNTLTILEDAASGVLTNILANDSDVDNTLLPTNIDLNTGTAGIQTSITTTAGSWTLNTTNGNVTFVPALNFNGTATLPYEICDGGTPNLCAQANLIVTVTAVNDAPVAVDNTLTILEDAASGVLNNIIANDSDVDNTLVPTNIDLNTTLAGIQTSITTTAGSWTLNTANGNVTFVPALNFNGTATLPYEICDGGTPNQCAQANLVVTVTAVNDAPVAVNNTLTILEDAASGVLTNILANDSDVDNTLLPTNIDLNTGTAGIQTSITTTAGSWTVNTTNGNVTFVPALNFNGTATLPYEICDGGTPNLCAQANLIVTVTAVNDAPVAVDNTLTILEDAATGVLTNIIANDSDVDNTLVPTNIDLNTTLAGVQTSITTTAGSWTLNTTNGNVTFVPALNFNGTATLPYEICDGGTPNQCAQANLVVTVTAVNDAPVAVNNTVTVNEDNTATLTNILANDSDVDNTLLPTNIDLNTGTAGIQTSITTTAGSWTVNTTNGNVTFVPALNFNGTATLPYEICDGGTPNLCAQANLIVTVTAVNDAPVAVNDSTTIAEDNTATLPNILANDSDVDNTLSATNIDLNTGTAGIQTFITTVQGTWTLNTTNGNVTFVPVLNFNGTATLPYEICDGGTPNQCAQANLVVTVTPVNDPPVADANSTSTNDHTPVTFNITSTDTDIDGTINTTSVDLDPVAPGQQTSVTTAAGSWSVNATGDLTYTPSLNYDGIAILYYTVEDNDGLVSNEGEITVIVTAENETPVIDNEYITTLEDTPVSGDLTDAGDYDPDGNLVVNTTPLSGPAHGTILINTNGTYAYTPATNYNGNDTIVVQICDDGTPLPAICVNDTIFVSVTAVNDVPVIDNENITTLEDTPVSGDLTDAGDSDVDGNLVATTTPVAGPNHGTIVINTDGTYTYTPDADYNGNDTIVVQICDDGTPLPANCVNDTIFVSVTAVNDAPVVDNENITTLEDTPVSGDLTDAGDSDVDGNLVINTTPVLGPTNGTILINADGTYTYTPNSDYNGNDTIVVQICDDGTPLPAICVNDTIFVSVTAVNDVPVIDNENITTLEDTPVSGDLTDAGDSDVDGNLVATTTPVAGPNHGTILINTDGTYTYTPDADYNGNDTIVVQICDDGTPLPANCVNDTIFVSVTAVNDAPVLDNENITTLEDTPVSGDLTDAGDSDVDGNLVINTNPVSGPDHGIILINADGTYTYTPDADYNGNDTIVVQICDDGTPLPAICVNDTIFVSVTAVNDVPVIDNENITTLEDTPVSGDLTDAGDSDVDGNLVATTTPVAGPNHGTILINTDGTYTYTPDADYNGNDTIVVQICDDGTPLPANCVNDTIFVSVTAVNDAPVVDNENITTLEDTPVSGDLTDAGDSDVDGNLVATTTPVSGPDHGTILINADGTYTYTPDANYFGNDTIVVQICDDGTPLPAICVNDTIFVSVTSVNDNPVADDDFATTSEDAASITINITGTDTDLDGTINHGSVDLDPTTPGQQTTVTNSFGTWTVNSSGDLTYMPAANYNGTATITYTVNDNDDSTSNVATVTITVNPVNDAPVVDNEYLTTLEDTPVSGDLTDAGDSDIDGNLIASGTPVNGPHHGTIVISANGLFTYTPNANFNGRDTIVVRICDDGTPLPAICVNDTIFVTVTPVNDPPVIDNEHITTFEGIAVSGDLTNAGDSDVDGNLVVTTTPVAGPDHGTITINADGTYTYIPTSGYVGNDTIVVQICDDGTPLPAICLNDTIFVTVDACSLSNPLSDCDHDGLSNGDEATIGTDPQNPDTDGDGVSDGKEHTDGTNPLDPCQLIVANQDLSPGTVWMDDDCDSDGLTNGEETTGVDNPSTPENPNGAITDPLSGDSDGDGVTDGDEAADGTDPNDPCDFVVAHATVAHSAGWLAADCDGDGSPNGQEVADGTDPNNPCDLVLANQSGTPSQAWLDSDCDSDGLTNGEETTGVNDPSTPDNPNGNITDPLHGDSDGDGVSDSDESGNGTNPNDPCDYTPGSVTMPHGAAWLAADCDGDGVSNGQEVTDGTDPNEPCSMVLASQNTTPSQTWLDSDCDVDGLTNGEETTGVDNPTTPANPHGTITNPLVQDTDGDGVSDGIETIDGTDPNNPCMLIQEHQVVTPAVTPWASLDCDGDGLTNGEETTGIDNPATPGNPNGTITDPLNPDSDGDGVTDGRETVDGTNPNNPCEYLEGSGNVPPTADWNNGDCDGDGVTNGDELLDGTNPRVPCDFLTASITLTADAAWNALDCDGDGVTNGDEITDGTDPQNPCDLKTAHQTVAPSTAWNLADCDGDGINNGTETANGSDPLNSCSPNACDIEIPEAFTPDGDGINDFFVIQGADMFPQSEITIFNRWGNVVYTAAPYKNDWNGTSNASMNVNGGELPTGTYYYIFDTKDPSREVMKGYVYIQR